MVIAVIVMNASFMDSRIIPVFSGFLVPSFQKVVFLTYLLSLLKGHNIVIKQMIQQLFHDQIDTILLYSFQLN